jgi:hypothetical protein
MRNQLRCGTEGRRQAVKDSSLNGIDYIEIIPSGAPNTAPLIIIRFFKPVSIIGKNNILITGGTRIRDIGIEWAERADKFTLKQQLQVEQQQQLLLLISDHEKEIVDDISSTKDAEYYLIVRPSSDGDFSTYSLKLIFDLDNKETPPKGFDHILSSIDFFFKVECASDFDCSKEHMKKICPPKVVKEPQIDYMAKDFASFRLLVRNRLAQIMPAWKEDNPADIGIVLMEMLAYIGDHLSYYQDAVATEAYLGTSRSRISVKRHARLLDYFINEGCNARACIFIQVDRPFDGNTIPQGTKLLTKGLIDKAIVTAREAEREILEEGAKVFETMHDIKLYSYHNEIQFYTWSESNCCLPQGSTSATLKDYGKRLKLQVGDLLLFEEIRSPSGGEHDEDPSHKHIVRLTKAERNVDELTHTPIIDISWDKKDALPFPLCLSELTKQDGDNADNNNNYDDHCSDIEQEKEQEEQDILKPVSIARGNIVLADHGNTITREPLEGKSKSRKKFRPRLIHKGLTFRGPFDQFSPVSTAFDYNAWDAEPAIYLEELLESAAVRGINAEFGAREDKKEANDKIITRWKPVSDLISSDRFSREFVIEMENDGTAQIRFGDDKQGMNPETSLTDGLDYSAPLYATYRVGNGVEGNIGSKTITRIVDSKRFDTFGIIKVYNPMPTKGAKDPESLDEIVQKAPYAFRKQERAVTEFDYVDILKRRSDIQGAAAKIQWTGSWYTVYIAVDAYGGRKKVDNKFKADLRKFLDNYRSVGSDVEILEPKYVPLLIEVKVYVDEYHDKSEIRKELLELFSNRVLSEGRLGFFHPDNLTFGQSVILSKIYSTIMKVDGVTSTTVTKFSRMDRPNYDYREVGKVEMSLFEIAQLDNDASFPENGRISFVVEESGM